jgi:type II secretory ATPase GspE/PulE/Tfp pilus assembly ATPase PilB-like protein
MGRHGIFEMMGMNYELRQMILKNCSSGDLRDVAKKHGLRTLREDGWRLVQEGLTTPDEVMRVTKDQSMDGKA